MSVYWLCFRGSRGTRNTWAQSLNLRKTPLSFPETGVLDVFISSSTPWPKGNLLKTENRKQCPGSPRCVFIAERNTQASITQEILWGEGGTQDRVYSFRGGDGVMDGLVYQINEVHKFYCHRKNNGCVCVWASVSIQPLLNRALLQSCIKHSRCNPWLVNNHVTMDPTLTSRGLPSSQQQCYSSVQQNRHSTVPRSECKNVLYCVFTLETRGVLTQGRARDDSQTDGYIVLYSQDLFTQK